MALPFFYADEITSAGAELALDEATARHVNQVLRMKKGDRLCITNGKGKKLTAIIQKKNKIYKTCQLWV